MLRVEKECVVPTQKDWQTREGPRRRSPGPEEGGGDGRERAGAEGGRESEGSGDPDSGWFEDRGFGATALGMYARIGEPPLPNRSCGFFVS